MRSLKAPRIGFVYALVGSLVLYASAALVSPAPAYAGIGKIRAVVFQVLEELGIISDGAYSGVGAHAMLNGGLAHNDTAAAAAAVSRGSLIYGNATPAWDELTVGGSGTWLSSDGTDVSWSHPSWQIELPVSAGVASISSTTYPAFTTASGSGIPRLDWDGSTKEAIEWDFRLPTHAYDSASDTTFTFDIGSASTSQATRWEVTVADLDGADTSTAIGSLMGTAVYGTATTSGTANTATTVSITVTHAQMGSPSAAGNMLRVRLARDAASAQDTSVADCFTYHSLRISQ